MYANFADNVTVYLSVCLHHIYTIYYRNVGETQSIGMQTFQTVVESIFEMKHKIKHDNLWWGMLNAEWKSYMFWSYEALSAGWPNCR